MLQKFISATILVVFIILMLLSKKNRNELYVYFLLIMYPFLSFDLFPSTFSIRLFDCLTFFHFLFFYEKNQIISKKNIHSQVIKILFLIIVFSNLIRALIYDDITVSYFEIAIQLLSIYLFSSIFYSLILSNNDFVFRIQSVFIYLLIFSFLFLFMQFIFGTSFTIAKSPNINTDGGFVVRYPSFFQDPQKYGQFLAAISFLILLRGKEPDLSVSNVILFFSSVLALLYTGARFPLLGWLLSFSIFILLFPARRKYLFLPILFISVLFIYRYFDNIPLFNRASVDDSYDFRTDIWLAALSIFEHNPILGIGLGNYQYFVEIFHPDQYWILDNDVTYFDHPESGYLKLLTEMGLFGFIPFVLIIIYIFIAGIKSFFISRNLFSGLSLLSLFTWIIGFSTVYSIGDVRILLLIIVISGCILSSFNYFKYNNLV